MRRILLVVLLAACYEPRPREPDPWEKYANQPVPAGNLRVRINTFEFEASEREAYGLAARYKSGDVVVTAGDISANGVGVWAVRAAFVSEMRTTRRDQEQFLLMADGTEGQMHVVESSPMPVTRVIPIYNGAVIVRTIEQVVTGSGMYVRPESQSDGTVLVEATPYVSYREGRGISTIRLTELSVTLRVRPGQPVVILAHEEAEESFGAAFFSARSSRGLRRVLQVLTVEK